MSPGLRESSGIDSAAATEAISRSRRQGRGAATGAPYGRAQGAVQPRRRGRVGQGLEALDDRAVARLARGVDHRVGRVQAEGELGEADGADRDRAGVRRQPRRRRDQHRRVEQRSRGRRHGHDSRSASSTTASRATRSCSKDSRPHAGKPARTTSRSLPEIAARCRSQKTSTSTPSRARASARSQVTSGQPSAAARATKVASYAEIPPRSSQIAGTSGWAG